MELIALFDILVEPQEQDKYSFAALPIEGYENHRISKDKFARPSLLIAINGGNGHPNLPAVTLKNIAINFDVLCKIKQAEAVLTETFTIISYTGNDQELQKYFLQLCSNLLRTLGNYPQQADIRREVYILVELFKLINDPPKNSIQGLWCELLIIADSKEPDTLLTYWHDNPEDKFDFTDEEEKLEVKSTSNNLRIHNFSIEQLNPQSNESIIIASVFVEPSSNGYSIFDLRDVILKFVNDNAELIQKLDLVISRTLGRELSKADNIKFDYHFAKQHLRYYSSESIPKIRLENIPEGVLDISFRSDLTNVPTLSKKDLKVFKSSLIKAI